MSEQIRKEDQQPVPQVVRFSSGDIALILVQALVGLVLIGSIPQAGIRFFAITCAAYTFMLCAVAVRSRKHGLTANDRKILLFGFIPLSVVTIILAVLIWTITFRS